MARQYANLEEIFYSFLVRFRGILTEWYNGLRVYHQLEFLRSPSIASTIGWIYYEFLGLKTNPY